jgi:thioredoxin 1
MATIHVTDDNFEALVLHSPLPVVVDFWAEWCNPCKMIAPALEDISAELEGQVVIAKLNTEEAPETAMKYNIRNIPYLAMIKNGEVVANKLGAAPKSALKSWIEGAL